MKIPSILALTIVALLQPLFLCAQEVSVWDRKYYFAAQQQAAAERVLTALEDNIPPEQIQQEQLQQQQARKTVVEEALRNVAIELALEYAFCVRGNQIFEVVDEQGMRISRLHYPNRGQMYTYKGEVRFFDIVGIGGRYSSSNFSRSTATDTDWIPEITPDLIWLESHSTNKAKIESFDMNVYYRLMDINAGSSQMARDLFDLLRLKNGGHFTLDAFAGYLEHKGRYGMTDGAWTIAWWWPVDEGIYDLNSFYKVSYKGPRFGLRAGGSSGKLATEISFAYAVLKTKAYGWWNLRDYSFEQNGKNGYGIEAGLNTSYSFTPHLALGIGLNYTYYRQKGLKESGNQPGGVYDELDIIRNVESTVYSPTLFLKYKW